MYEGKSVTTCLFEAFWFVLDHLKACYLLATPIILFSILTTAFSFISNPSGSTEEHSLTLIISTTILEAFFFAMFAVSWHRYTAFETERNVTGPRFRLGPREIKFALFNVTISVLLVGLMGFLTVILQTGAGGILVAILSIPVLMIMFFAYPAIALDQPLRFNLFLEAGTKRFLSFLKAFFIAGLLILVWALLIWILTWLLGGFADGGFQVLLRALLDGLVLIPISTAVAVSMATKLYMDVFAYIPPQKTVH